MIAKGHPLEQKALWIAVILSQILVGFTAIILPIPYVLFLIALIPALVIFYSKPILGLMLAIPFIPNYPIILFSVGRADITLFELAFFVAFFSWLLLCIRDNKIKLYASDTDIAIFLILGWVLFSLFWATSLQRGIFQILHILPPVSLYFLHIHMIKDKKDFNLIISTWVVVAIFSSVVGFYETVFYGVQAAEKLTIAETYTRLTRGVRATALFVKPDTLGIVMSLSIVLAITKYIITPSKMWKFFLLILLPIMFFVLASSFSRKSFLGLFVALIYISWRNKKVFNLVFGIGMSGLFLILALATGGFLEALWNRILSYFMAPEVAIASRWVAWQIAFNLFLQSPIVGNGIGSFFISAQILESPLNITHNFYLYVLAELGLMGLGLVLFWYFQIFQSFSRFLEQSKDETANFICKAMVAGLFVLLIQSGFRTFQFTDQIYWGFLGLASAFLRIYTPTTCYNEKAKSDV